MLIFRKSHILLSKHPVSLVTVGCLPCGFRASIVVADARARFDLRRICHGVAGEDLQRTIGMPGLPALQRAMLTIDVLEEIGAGHGAVSVCDCVGKMLGHCRDILTIRYYGDLSIGRL